MWVVTIDGFKRGSYRTYADAVDSLDTYSDREQFAARIILAAQGERRKLSYRLAAKTKQKAKWGAM